jgi:hypothetical protein
MTKLVNIHTTSRFGHANRIWHLFALVCAFTLIACGDGAGGGEQTHTYTWVAIPGSEYWEAKPGDETKEREMRKEEEVSLTDGSKSGKTRDVPTGNERPKVLSLPSITPKDVNVVQTIADWSGDSSIKSLTWAEALESSTSMLSQFSEQAETLRAFFDGAEESYYDLAPRFTAMKDAEKAIKDQANQTNGLTSYYSTVASQQENIFNGIFGGGDRTTFNKYLAAYKQWSYLVSRDWKTMDNPGTTGVDEGNDAAQLAVDNFVTAVNATGDSNLTPVGSNPFSNGRGATFNVPANYGPIKMGLENALKEQIVTALGIGGADNITKANAMAQALITQLGQDNQEFLAFINDLQAEGLNTALNYDYTVAGYVE